jgi:nicotinamidase-related amidase
MFTLPSARFVKHRKAESMVVSEGEEYCFMSSPEFPVTAPEYEIPSTALLFVDPYNDFLSEGGQVWPFIKDVAEDVGLIENLRRVNNAVRDAGVQVFIVPHRRWRQGDYDNWKYPNPTQQMIMHNHTFAEGTWGGEWHPEFGPRDGDVIASEHWAQSGFANTDLDFQLKQHGITHVIVIGLLANTCIETTARYAMELGYHVTLVKDATAAFEHQMMHSAHELDGPTFAHAIVTTTELLAAIPKPQNPS